MTHFTPYSALMGGVLIGLSAALLMLTMGKIAGISGILSNIIKFDNAKAYWQFYFIAGLFFGAFLLNLILDYSGSIYLPKSPIILVIAGLLVGYGTRLGNGCTSGHAVCGLARLSKRSAVATLTFMLTAMLTVYVMRHLLT